MTPEDRRTVFSVGAEWRRHLSLHVSAWDQATKLWLAFGLAPHHTTRQFSLHFGLGLATTQCRAYNAASAATMGFWAEWIGMGLE